MIDNLSIARFKAIRSASLHLRTLNIFAGINGMGKSTCIQAMLLLRQSHLARTLPQGLLLRGSLVDLGRGEDVFHQFANEETVEFGLGTSAGTAKWVFKVGEKQGLDREILPLENFEETYKDGDDPYARQPFVGGFRYLSAERVRPEVAYETSFYSVFELDQIGTRGELAVHYLAEHQHRPLDIPSLKHPKVAERQVDLLSNVRAWMGEISPGISLNVEHHPNVQRASLEYDFDTGPSNRFTSPLRPINVGFGITYVLPIVIAALSSKAGDMLIVENPESHLHPSGQSAIGKLLALVANGGVQVMIETHSDHLLNGVRLAVKRGSIDCADVGVFFFSRVPGDPAHATEIVTPRIDRNGKIAPWPRGFFDETEKLLFELL